MPTINMKLALLTAFALLSASAGVYAHELRGSPVVLTDTAAADEGVATGGAVSVTPLLATDGSEAWSDGSKFIEPVSSESKGNYTIPFESPGDLHAAVRAYMSEGCPDKPDCQVGKTYGWPMNSWDVSKVTSFAGLFDYMLDFNEDVSGWDTSSVTTMFRTFRWTNKFNQDINGWNVSRVTSFQAMFRWSGAFDGDLSNWDTSSAKVISMFVMWNPVFKGKGMENWDTSNVEEFIGVSFGNSAFNADISGWNTSKGYNFRGFAQEAPSFNIDISGWDVSKAIEVGHFFYKATSFNQNLCSWGLQTPTRSAEGVHSGVFTANYLMFKDSGCEFQEDPVKNQLGPFCYQCDPPAPYFTNKVELRNAIEDYNYQDCKYEPDCEVGQRYGYPMNKWDVSRVTNFNRLFFGLSRFNEDISAWDTSSVTSMTQTFAYCKEFNQNVGGWDVSNVRSFVMTFNRADAFNQDLLGWDVSNVKGGPGFLGMFHSANEFNGDISTWKVSKAMTSGMFFMNKSFNRDLPSWSPMNTDKMFYAALAFNQDLSDWQLDANRNIHVMFAWAESFNQNLCAWEKEFDENPILYKTDDGIFKGCPCTYTEDPVEADGGPFCASDCM